MQFEKGHLYHIYNQGNNRQQIFFERENYLFFLKKMRTYLLPYCDIIAYCLMPNHFHWMVSVNAVTVPITHRVTSSHPMSKERTLNDSIAILLRSYTRAINKQENRSGKLFREATKAECLTLSEGVTPSFYSTPYGTSMHISHSEKEYPHVCFDYIHQNPVKANLVSQTKDWEFSSYRDYAGFREGTLINKEVAKEYITF